MDHPLAEHSPRSVAGAAPVYWRVEGSLLDLSAVRPVAFFTWNAQRFSERWTRRGGLALLAVVRPLLYVINRVFATRVLHLLLRGVSRDRLDLLGEEYFQYELQPLLKPQGVQKLRDWIAANGQVILVSQGLDHVMRPLANHLGVERLLANRMEFRDGLATGRLLDPVIRPRGIFARLLRRSSDGRISPDQLSKDIGREVPPEAVHAAIAPARRQLPHTGNRVVVFRPGKTPQRLSVRHALAGKRILLIGVTGFIGKVWLIHLLTDLPELGKIYLLIRRQGPNSALRRFEKIVEESPVFDALFERHGAGLAEWLAQRVEVIEGDVTQPGLGIDPETRACLTRSLDAVVNSSGLVDFNPDLRDALATNVDGTLNVMDFVRGCDHAGLVHLSTCYVVGSRDGRIGEELAPDYNPEGFPNFDAELERQRLHDLVRQIEERSATAEVTKELRRLVMKKGSGGEKLSGDALENQLRKQRTRWIRKHLTRAGTRRARHMGWPNTYTFSKSLSESLIQRFGSDLPIAIVRPSIVETSTRLPFQGWNEGINTSAPLSYLLGTYFRQLPSNERKCLDVIPVDLVCRGITLITAALVQRAHEKIYQLATSAVNPCDMRRSIELTCLAHRKYYRSQDGFEHWFRSKFDTIPVSKARYRKFSAPVQKTIVQAINRTAKPLPLIRAPLERAERNLIKVEKLIELYEPFILLNEQTFEAGNVQLLSEALPPEEKDAFGYDATSIDWWEYWINIHIPAQRKWSYPLIEGRPLEARPPRSFALPSSAAVAGAGSAPLNGTLSAARQAKSPLATWPSS
jgi:alcohol-forming fatty acyl-CoA reductase